MSEIENPPAFPLAVPELHVAAHDGMSLRDWFAGQFLPVATREVPEWQLKAWFGDRTGVTREEIAATQSYRMADAMLAARTNKGSAQ